jgi:hypothetical protein
MKITLNLTGTPTDAEKRGMTWEVERQNKLIEAENESRAAQDPPLDLLPLIDYSTNAKLRNAVEPMLIETVKHKLSSLTSQSDNEVVSNIVSLVGDFDASDLQFLETRIQQIKERRATNEQQKAEQQNAGSDKE